MECLGMGHAGRMTVMGRIPSIHSAWDWSFTAALMPSISNAAPRPDFVRPLEFFGICHDPNQKTDTAGAPFPKVRTSRLEKGLG